MRDNGLVMGDFKDWDQVKKFVLNLEFLPDEWDGDNFKVVRREIITSVLCLADKLARRRWEPPYSIYLLPNGNIAFEWQYSDKSIDRIEIEGIGVGERMTTYPNAPTMFERMYWPRPTEKDELIQAKAEIESLQAEIERLRAGIRKHMNMRGDDRCDQDNHDLYLLLPEGDTRPAREVAVTIENCQRFIECQQRGQEYVSPQRRIEELEAEVTRWKNLYTELKRAIWDVHGETPRTDEQLDEISHCRTRLQAVGQSLFFVMTELDVVNFFARLDALEAENHLLREELRR